MSRGREKSMDSHEFPALRSLILQGFAHIFVYNSADRRHIMNNEFMKAVGVLILTAAWLAPAFGQGILANDTLYIGHVTGVPGQKVMVPLYMRTTDYYQGWTLPLKFGNGTAPVFCDSVSFAGTIMENWAWKSRFVNNNQWDNVQTCGATGLYVWAGDSMLPGYYLALKLFFTIASNATPQTVGIDTTTCSFAPGGQQNNFIVVVHTQSWLTRIVPGAVTIGLVGVQESSARDHRTVALVYPTVVQRGSAVTVKVNSSATRCGSAAVYDADGRMINELIPGPAGSGEYTTLYQTGDLAHGVYFVVVKDGDWSAAEVKLIVK
jgi:hypothetical protein